MDLFNELVKKLDLYEHNIDACLKVKEAIDNGEDAISVIHATGTGKTRLALFAILYYLNVNRENLNKNILYIVPSNGIMEHLIEEIKLLNLEYEFKNLSIITYQSFINMSKEEIKEIKCDLAVIDELHHLGAPVWGERIKTLCDTHPNMIKFGMTAYNVRDRGTAYERDMTNPLTDEIFSNTVVSFYDLYDAMIDGVLPKPIYKTIITENNEELLELERTVELLKNKNISSYKEYEAMLLDFKRMTHTNDDVKRLIKRSLKKNGKYIYFCPVGGVEDGKNDIDTIMKEIKIYLLEDYNEEDLCFYKSTSKDGEIGKLNRDCFYSDVDLKGNNIDNKLRIIFVKNQYNEGVHAPNVDGVILGRYTKSDIVAFEQIGRGLSVRGNTKEQFVEYEKYTTLELKKLARKRMMKVSDNDTKLSLISKLTSPLILDLSGNIKLIEELETNLKDRVREKKENNKNNPSTKREIKIEDVSFDVEIVNKNLLDVLRRLNQKISDFVWGEWYKLAENYYKQYGNSEISYEFKTKDGINYDEKGVNLGHWISTQRKNQEKMTEERKKKLELIEFRFDNKFDIEWNKMYDLAHSYYKHYGNSEISHSFKTKDGINYDEKGVNLGHWISTQRKNQEKMTEERKKKLELIEFRFEIKDNNIEWNKMYDLAHSYYKHYGNSEISHSFKTKDGINYDEKGVNLGHWISTQRTNQEKMTEERKKKLELIEFRFEIKDNNIEWNKMYDLAHSYYKQYGNSKIPKSFKTKDGINYDEKGVNLGHWISAQRTNQEKMTEERKKKLELIEFRFEIKDNNIEWNKMYDLAHSYYKHYGNSEISHSFKTKDGINYDEKGVNLGHWISTQRTNQEKMTEERKKKLELIEFRFEIKDNNIEWNKMYDLAHSYYKQYGNSKIPKSFKTKDGINYDEKGVNLGHWISAQRTNQEKMTEERKKKLELIEFKWSVRRHKENLIKVCEEYNLDYKKYKFLVDNISYQELIAKINYLLENGQELMPNNELNPIFEISSIDMKEEIGIDKKELIETYYINKQGRGK